MILRDKKIMDTEFKNACRKAYIRSILGENKESCIFPWILFGGSYCVGAAWRLLTPGVEAKWTRLVLFQVYQSNYCIYL